MSLTARLDAWFRQRSRREQRLLLVMAALFALVVLWLGIIAPITDGNVAARARHAEAVSELGRVRADAAALGTLSRRERPVLEAPLATVVGAALAGAGFANAGVTPQGTTRVTASIASARPNALFTVLADMEARGILVERISVRANADQTVAADMTLIGRGG